MNYRVQKVSSPGSLGSNPTEAAWSGAEVAAINHFRPESSDHRPQTNLRLLHDERGIHGMFTVSDRYVRCVRTAYGSEVWNDSCVECFLEPKPGRGYFNFEFNCGGTFLCNHVSDPTRVGDGFKQATRLSEAVVQPVQVRAQLPRIIDPEISEPLDWSLKFYIPCAVLEHFVGPIGNLAGQVWRGNFFKCAEDNSHPHWVAWSPVDEFNFHLPRCFGDLEFM